MSAVFHVTPAPDTVAAVFDSCGRHAARERWGWLDVSTLDRLAREGRIASGRGPVTGRLNAFETGGHLLLNRSWDGAEPRSPYLPLPLAATALGVSLSHLSP